VVVNTYFKKKKDHLVAFKSGSIKTQINYFRTRADNKRLCEYYKVIASEYYEVILNY